MEGRRVAFLFWCGLWQYAENVAESLTTGTRVIVTGRLKQRSYETQNGERRTVFEIEVDEVGLALRSATAKVTRIQREGGFGGGNSGGGGNYGGGNSGGGGGYGSSSGGGGQDPGVVAVAAAAAATPAGGATPATTRLSGRTAMSVRRRVDAHLGSQPQDPPPSDVDIVQPETKWTDNYGQALAAEQRREKDPEDQKKPVDSAGPGHTSLQGRTCCASSSTAADPARR